MSAKWAIESIRCRRIKASNPSNFNDPFEISPNFDISKYDRNFVRKLCLEEYLIAEDWRRLEPKIFPDFKTFREHRIRNVEKLVDSKIDEVQENIRENQKSFLSDYSRSWRLISFSRSIDSILLWSHYANKHRGIALGFDTDDPYISDLGEEWVLDVLYSSKKAEFEPWFDKDGFSREIRKATRWKSLEWAYEQEVRVVVAVTALIDDFYPFQGSSLKSVHFGINCSEADIAEVAMHLAAQDLRRTALYKGIPDPEDYKLDFTKIDI